MQTILYLYFHCITTWRVVTLTDRAVGDSCFIVWQAKYSKIDTTINLNVIPVVILKETIKLRFQNKCI